MYIFLINDSHVLFAEDDLTGFVVHAIDDRQRFQMISQIADYTATDLEALFDYNAQTFDRCTGTVGNRDQTKQSTTISQEVIDDQYTILLSQELFGNDYLIFPKEYDILKRTLGGIEDEFFRRKNYERRHR